jgi:hypothetical protein
MEVPRLQPLVLLVRKYGDEYDYGDLVEFHSAGKDEVIG